MLILLSNLDRLSVIIVLVVAGLAVPCAMRASSFKRSSTITDATPRTSGVRMRCGDGRHPRLALPRAASCAARNASVADNATPPSSPFARRCNARV